MLTALRLLALSLWLSGRVDAAVEYDTDCVALCLVKVPDPCSKEKDSAVTCLEETRDSRCEARCGVEREQRQIAISACIYDAAARAGASPICGECIGRLVQTSGTVSELASNCNAVCRANGFSLETNAERCGLKK